MTVAAVEIANKAIRVAEPPLSTGERASAVTLLAPPIIVDIAGIVFVEVLGDGNPLFRGFEIDFGLFDFD